MHKIFYDENKMDHVAEFEKNVKTRIRDFKSLEARVNKKKPIYDHRAAFMFLGIAFGVISSQVACLCRTS